MKLRWRIVIALALSGLIPLLPLFLVVRDAVDLGAESLAPPEIGEALLTGVAMTRDLVEMQTESLRHRLVQIAKDIPPPPATHEFLKADLLDDSEELIVSRGRNSFRLIDHGWESFVDVAESSEEFMGIPEVIEADTTLSGLRWELEGGLDPELRKGALALQSMRAQWTLRSYERDRLINSLVITYLIFYLVVVAFAVSAALFVIVPATRRIERLARVMDAVGKGDENVRADEMGDDEIGRLATTFNLMIDRLESSRRRAADMEKMAGWRELARVLAHEIKNPLTPIQLSVQQITDSYQGDDPRFNRLLETTREVVDEEIESLRKLVREFSDFARAPQLEPAEVDPALIAEEIASLYGDRLEVDVKAIGFPVPLDREMLKRALINLVDNALHIVDKETGKIHMTLVHDVEHLRFTVEDNGPGVQGENREKIFEPYVTGRRSGIGLGLPVVRSVSRQHGGDAYVIDSEILGGACFVIDIPAKGIVAKD